VKAIVNENGREIVNRGGSFWAPDKKGEWSDFEYDNYEENAIKLVPDKKSYKPGETAHVLAMLPKDKAHFDKSLCGKYMYIVIMSVMLIANSYFKTKAATHLDSAQLYPLNQGMALILSTLMASVFFKEKLTLKCVVGIFIAFIGLIVMNVL
jgi:multidrug transporter EmrE-like cation transporter